MHILVIDGHHVEAEFRQKFGEAHEYRFIQTNVFDEDGEEIQQQRDRGAVIPPDVIFWFQQGGFWNWEPGAETKAVLFVEASRHPVPSIAGLPTFGFCGLPTLLNRSLLEVSLSDAAGRDKLAEVCAALGTDYRIVDDRVGLVTPRVLCMIINEACYTVQEGTATMRDIDLGMKLGTSYPRGPFEWANLIGVERVYAVLEALWNDTHDERYKICPLLKKQARRAEPFAV